MKTKLAIALLALTQILSWAQITNGGVAVLINRTNRSVLNSGFWPSNAIAMSNALSGIGFTGGGGSFDTNRFVSTNHTGDIWLNGRRIYDHLGYATGFEGTVHVTDTFSTGYIETDGVAANYLIATNMTLGGNATAAGAAGAGTIRLWDPPLGGYRDVQIVDGWLNLAGVDVSAATVSAQYGLFAGSYLSLGGTQITNWSQVGGSNFNSIVVTNSLQLGIGTNAVTFTSAQNGASASDAAFTFGTVNASTGVFGSFRATSASIGSLTVTNIVVPFNSVVSNLHLNSDTMNSQGSELIGDWSVSGGGNFVVSGNIAGNGFSITNLNAAELSGLVPSAQLNGVKMTNVTIVTTNFVDANTVYAGNFRLKDSTIWNTSTGKEIIIRPNATGALQADDNGNNRGDYANDFQRQRTTNIQVAAGANSVILGGSNNRAANSHSVVVGGQDNYALTYATVVGGASNSATANYSFVGGGASNTATNGSHSVVSGGLENTASGAYSFVSGGLRAKATRQGEMSHASGFFSNPGDAQRSAFVARGNTSLSLGTTRQLTLNGTTSLTAANTLVIPANSAWQFDIRVCAYNDTTTDLAAGWHIRGAVKRFGDATSTLGTTESLSWRDTGFGGPQVSVVGDDATDTLAINVDSGGITTPMRWVAVIDIVQVSFGTP